MDLYLINGIMLLALAFGFYITQSNRKYFCATMFKKIVKSIKL